MSWVRLRVRTFFSRYEITEVMRRTSGQLTSLCLFFLCAEDTPLLVDLNRGGRRLVKVPGSHFSLEQSSRFLIIPPQTSIEVSLSRR